MSELVYRIEIKQTNVIVRIEERGVKRVLYLDTLKQLADKNDQEALHFLTKIHLRSPNASRSLETLSFNQIELIPSQTNVAIRLMGKTGRLYFEKEKVAISPVPLPILLKGERHSERQCTIEAFVEGRPLPPLLFPGSPPWILDGGIWSEVSDSIDWKWLALLSKGPLFLEGSELKKFLSDELSILWKEKKGEALQVFPELVLHDGTGCFANLWMDYPNVGRIAFEDLSPTVAQRGRLKSEEESWEKDLLETKFHRKIVGATRYFCPTDRVYETLSFLLELGWKIVDFKKKRVRRQTGIDLSIHENGPMIEVKGELAFDQQKVSLASQNLQKMWVDLDPESVGLVDRKALEPIVSIVQEGEWRGDLIAISKEKFSPFAPSLKGNINWDEKVEQMALGWGGSIPQVSIGEEFNGNLLPYQQKGVDWIGFLYRWGFSGLLADEMGLGKTVQVLAFFSQVRTKLPILVVMPTSLIYNWKREFERFLPKAAPYLHLGAQRLQEGDELQKVPFILTTYSILRLDEELFGSLNFEVVVLDESQAIKNFKTKTAKAAFQLQSRFRLALSGTPLENRLSEVASQFQFLLPNLLSLNDSMEVIKRRVRPYLLRRRKTDVAIELPEKIDQIVWLEMTEAQREIYEEYRSGIKKGLLKKVEEGGASAHRMEILEAILRLRQICTDPRLVQEGEMGAKLEHLTHEIEEIVSENRKVLIYSQFTSMLSLIRSHFQHLNPLYLDGSMGSAERSEQVRLFQEEPANCLFLLSLKAGGAGLNLTEAEYVFIFDPWWNSAVERQAIDRAHRIGQKKVVIAKRYLIVNSIEEKMLEMKEKKERAAEELLDGQEDLFNWTAEDLLHLLS